MLARYFITTAVAGSLLAAIPHSKGEETIKPAVEVASLKPDELESLSSQPKAIQRLIKDALALTELSLGYQYGSHDPERGGMDCSGTIYYLLRKNKVKGVPRQANLVYKWVWETSQFHAVVSENPSTFEMARLRPGDLLFWTGTYKVDRDPPVTHVMLYLGKKKADGKPVMFGASSGRSYAGKAHHGVSVFDFKFPRKGSTTKSGTRPRFIGYGSISGLRKVSPPAKIPGQKK